LGRAIEAKEIRENWFEDHVATLTQHGNLAVLSWKKPKSSFYYCRYVFDGYRLYIAGDIGEAVFEFSSLIDVHSFNETGLSYFHQKLSAYSEDKWDFNPDKAVKRLREWLNDLKEADIKYDHDEMKELFEEARECSWESEWDYILNNHDDFISALDPDYNEWARSAGNEIPARVVGYLVGLQMASEQLLAAETND
jgi:hypothetical protein